MSNNYIYPNDKFKINLDLEVSINCVGMWKGVSKDLLETRYKEMLESGELESLLKEHDPNRLWLLNSSDVLVDGPFILSKKTTTQPFIGSVNQRIIDIQSSFRQNSVIEMLVD